LVADIVALKSAIQARKGLVANGIRATLIRFVTRTLIRNSAPQTFASSGYASGMSLFASLFLITLMGIPVPSPRVPLPSPDAAIAVCTPGFELRLTPSDLQIFCTDLRSARKFRLFKVRENDPIPKLEALIFLQTMAARVAPRGGLRSSVRITYDSNMRVLELASEGVMGARAG